MWFMLAVVLFLCAFLCVDLVGKGRLCIHGMEGYNAGCIYDQSIHMGTAFVVQWEERLVH